MDDQQTYLLNGLLTRQYALGRIVRFRHVVRGRQASVFELLTSEQHEYLVSLFPVAHDRAQLAALAPVINTLDENRFSVVPMLKSKSDEFVSEGPQGTHLMVSLAAVGTAFPAEQYTEHDISQVGLRLAWLHRLLAEQIAPPAAPGSPLGQLDAALARRRPDSVAPPLPALNPEHLAKLRELLALPTPLGYTHGEFQAHALLMDGDHQLRTVTDWALLHWGHPLEDLLDAFLSLCVSGNDLIPNRARTLLESYASLIPLHDTVWSAVVGRWLLQRIVDASYTRRLHPRNFFKQLATPEDTASALASALLP